MVINLKLKVEKDNFSIFLLSFIFLPFILSNNKNNPISNSNVFSDVVTDPNTLIIVNYSSSITNIDNIIAAKNSNSNVVKGSLLP